MKKALVLISSFCAIFMLLLLSCKKKTAASTSYTPTCNSTKSFKNDVQPLIQNNCVSCHSNYSTYAQISSSASSIRSSIVNGSMPKGGTFTSSQKDNIVCWIDAGSPNN